MTKERILNYLKLLTPAIIGGLFIIMASFNISGAIWFDEGYSTALMQFGPKEIIGLTAKDVHPPLYYLLLKGWSLAFGESDAALRMMSVMFGALTILMGYLLAKQLLGRKAAVMAGATMALSPMLLRYSQEMRMYTLASFLVLAATTLFCKAVRVSDEILRSNGNVKDDWRRKYPRKIWGMWLGYGAIMALGMWTHYFTACVWIAQLAFLIYRYRKAIFSPLIVWSYGLAGALFLPWLPVMAKQTGAVQGGFWIPPISGQTLPDYVAETMMGISAGAAKNWLAIILIIIVILVSMLIKKYLEATSEKLRPQLEIILATIIIPVLFLMIVSLPPLKPMFVNRYLIHSAVTLWLMLGMAGGALIQKLLMQKKHFWGAITGVAMIGAPLAFDIGFVNMREPASYVKPAIITIREQSEREKAEAEAEKTVPILTADGLIFYQALGYSTPQRPIMTVKSWRKQILPYEPLDEMPEKVKENVTDITSKYERIWLIQEKNDAAEKEISEITASHRAELTINTGHYILTEFRKK